MRPKIAGIESSAKRMSVALMAIMTSSIGVRTRLPFSMVKNLSPSYSSVAGRTFFTRRTKTPSESSWESSFSSSTIILIAV